MMRILPSTFERVPLHTNDQINERIQQKTEQRVSLYGSAGKEAIGQRLRQLDDEWDIERVLEANAASVALAGVLLGATVSRRFFVLPGIVAGFLLQHALQGWCPPVPIFRRLGFRTAGEICTERFALKALRGDFEQIQPVAEERTLDPGPALEAARIH